MYLESDVITLYNKDKNLKRNDVLTLVEWVNKQPHLPSITEFQALIVLHSCYYSIEKSKTMVDNFITFRTICPELSKNQNLQKCKDLRQIADSCIISVLSKKTKEGYDVVYMALTDKNPEVFNFIEMVKYTSMVAIQHLHENGTSDGVEIVMDFKGAVLGHLAKVGILTAKKVLFYVQEATPLRLKRVHFCNIGSLADALMMLIKPFMNKQLKEMLHVHPTLDGVLKFVPLECLPKDLGGSEDSIAVLKEKVNSKLIENSALFEWYETLEVDETQRPEKVKNLSEYFGIDGSFKMLEVD